MREQKMDELYKRYEELMNKFDVDFYEIIRHFGNSETRYGDMPKRFMTNFLENIKLMNDLNLIILRQEKDKNVKAKYLDLKYLRLRNYFDLCSNLRSFYSNSELDTFLSILHEELDMCSYNLNVVEGFMTSEISSQNMSLYLIDGHEVNKKYAIFLPDLQVCIGEIGCSEIEYRNEKKINVFYRIFSDFRGHNYALDALNLMAEGLYQRGVNSLFFYIDTRNVASIKTAEKFGGVVTEQYNDVVTYEADLVKIFETKKSSIGK